MLITLVKSREPFKVRVDRIDMCVSFGPIQLILLFVALCSIDLIQTFHSEIICCSAAILFPIFYLQEFDKLTGRHRIFSLVLFCYIGIILLYKLMGVSSSSFSQLSNIIIWGLVSIAGIYYIDFHKKNEPHNYTPFYLLFFLTLIRILFLCIQSMVVSRSMWAELNNAPYGSMIMFFSGICLVWFLNDNKISHRVLSIFGFALSVYANLVVLQRAINTVLSVVMVVFIVLFNSKRKKVTRFIVVFFLGIVLYLYFTDGFLNIVDHIIDFLSDRSDRLYRRFLEIRLFLVYGDLDGAGGFSGRSGLLQNSMDSWLSSFSSFLVGIGDHRSSCVLVGNHCEMIDVFARYGLIGGVMLFSYFVCQVNFISEYLSRQNSILSAKIKSQSLVIIGILIVRNFFGDTFYPNIAIQIMFLLPLVADVCLKQKQNLPIYPKGDLQ